MQASKCMHVVKKSLINFCLCVYYLHGFLSNSIHRFLKKIETISLKYKTISLSIIVSIKKLKSFYITRTKKNLALQFISHCDLIPLWYFTDVNRKELKRAAWLLVAHWQIFWFSIHSVRFPEFCYQNLVLWNIQKKKIGNSDSKDCK